MPFNLSFGMWAAHKYLADDYSQTVMPQAPETVIDILPALKREGFPRHRAAGLGYCGLRRYLFLRCKRTSFLVKQERRWLCQPAVTPIHREIR